MFKRHALYTLYEDNMISLSSPAKINLFLRILKKRSDGYHELASLFQAIDLSDRLHFTLSQTDKLTCTDNTLPTDQSNLITKAVQLFRRKTNIKDCLNIHLEKNIPQQAGLGGGSSNAATTLWAFNQLCGKPASEGDLAKWGAEIGSDVPFFLSHGTAYCTGRGEQIFPIKPLENINLWIVKPYQGLSTPLVYKTLNVELLPQRNPIEALKNFFDNHSTYFNDLEAPAFTLIPDLFELKSNLLSTGFSTVMMSGSGTSFFCIGEGKIPNLQGIKSYRTRFINRRENVWFNP